MFLSAIVSTFVLLFVAVGNGQSTNCPDFVPTTKDTAQLTGQLYGSQYANVGYQKPGLRCLTKLNQVASDGTVTSSLTYKDTTSNDLKTFTAVATPVDHNRARLSTVSSMNPNSPMIQVLLDIDPGNYVIWAFCQTVGGKEGYTINVNSWAKQLSNESLDAIKAFLKASNLSDDLQPYDRENC